MLFVKIQLDLSEIRGVEMLYISTYSAITFNSRRHDVTSNIYFFFAFALDESVIFNVLQFPI